MASWRAPNLGGRRARHPFPDPDNEQSPSTVQAKKLVFPVLLVLAFSAGIGASLMLERSTAKPDIEGLLWPEPRKLEAFELVDQDGRPFDVARLHDRWTLLFFGYTFCPDVCPVTLSALAEAQAELAGSEAAADLQVVFISLDPERDTPQRLGEYVRFFAPEFLGVTGSEEALGVLTRQLGVIGFKGEKDADGNYLVDHTAAVMLLDTQARLVGIFRTPHKPADIAARVRGIREFING